MLDSTAEREAWEAEVRGVVEKVLDERTAEDVIQGVDGKFYTSFGGSASGNRLVTFSDLWNAMNDTDRNRYALEKQIAALEAWRNTRWHVKAGRAIKGAWDGFILPLIVSAVVVFMLYCTLTVVIGWLS